MTERNEKRGNRVNIPYFLFFYEPCSILQLIFWSADMCDFRIIVSDLYWKKYILLYLRYYNSKFCTNH